MHIIRKIQATDHQGEWQSKIDSTLTDLKKELVRINEANNSNHERTRKDIAGRFEDIGDRFERVMTEIQDLKSQMQNFTNNSI